MKDTTHPGAKSDTEDLFAGITFVSAAPGRREDLPAWLPCPGCDARLRLGMVTCLKCWRTVPAALRDAWLRADSYQSDERWVRAIFRHFDKAPAQVQLRRSWPVLTQGDDVGDLLRASPYWHADERFGGKKIECPGCLGLMEKDWFVCPSCTRAGTALLDVVLSGYTTAETEAAWLKLMLALRTRAGAPLTDIPLFFDLRPLFS